MISFLILTCCNGLPGNVLKSSSLAGYIGFYRNCSRVKQEGRQLERYKKKKFSTRLISRYTEKPGSASLLYKDHIKLPLFILKKPARQLLLGGEVAPADCRCLHSLRQRSGFLCWSNCWIKPQGQTRTTFRHDREIKATSLLPDCYPQRIIQDKPLPVQTVEKFHPAFVLRDLLTNYEEGVYPKGPLVLVPEQSLAHFVYGRDLPLS